MRWTEIEIDYVMRQFTMFHSIPSWKTIASNVNFWVSQDCGFNNNRSASACRHKYYELKTKQIISDVGSFPQEEKQRLLYKLSAMEDIR